MSEKKPEEGLVTIWADVQQKLLTGWLGLMQNPIQPSRKLAWNETVKTWQSTVDGTLDAQSRWLRRWTGRVQVTSGSPTELRKNVRHAQVVLLRWIEAQQHLWQGWFDLVQHLGRLLEAGCEADEQLALCLAGKRQANINAQSEWMRLWTSELPGRYSSGMDEIRTVSLPSGQSDDDGGRIDQGHLPADGRPA